MKQAALCPTFVFDQIWIFTNHHRLIFVMFICFYIHCIVQFFPFLFASYIL